MAHGVRAGDEVGRATQREVQLGLVRGERLHAGRRLQGPLHEADEARPGMAVGTGLGDHLANQRRKIEWLRREGKSTRGDPRDVQKIFDETSDAIDLRKSAGHQVHLFVTVRDLCDLGPVEKAL